MTHFGCQHECEHCNTPKACAFLREYDAARDEERRSAQMLGGVLFAVLVVAVSLGTTFLLFQVF